MPCLLRHHFFVCFLAVLALQTACTPALDWREVRFEGAMPASQAGQLNAVLPCKPDRATREQTVGGQKVQLSMMGCKAAGATFTLSRMVLATPASAPQVLAAWQTASLGLPNGAVVATQPIKILGASAWPPAGQTHLPSAGVSVDAAMKAAKMSGQIAWFAQTADAELVLYQAAIYGSEAGAPSADAIATFFDSLRLP
jgi:hypothetical protein